MRIAVISDIHSNIYALEAVLDDIKNRNIDLIACTGPNSQCQGSGFEPPLPAQNGRYQP